MGSATVRERSREEVAAERALLLERVRLSESELRSRAEAYLLTEEELGIWNRLKVLDWLASD